MEAPGLSDWKVLGFWPHAASLGRMPHAFSTFSASFETWPWEGFRKGRGAAQ